MLRRLLSSPQVRLLGNTAYAVWNCLLAFRTRSWWFLTLGIYCAILAAARFAVLMMGRKAQRCPYAADKTTHLTGILLLALSVCLIGINLLTALQDRGTVFGEIVMITIATYTFTKVTFAIIGMLRARKTVSPVHRALRSLTFADAIGSIYTLQRSMLVSFPGLQPEEIRLFNLLTGTGVWLTLLLLGLHNTGGNIIRMSENKIVKANPKIAETVVDGYKKIEKGVVDGYKKIEKGVVDGYTKVEDRFVDAYLKRADESVEEAKERLKKQS